MPGKRWVVSQPFVAHEGVRGVELVPGEIGAGRFERLADEGAAGERDMRVLPAPDSQ